MTSCPICYDEINNDSKYVTSCNHIFHKNCIDDWIIISDSLECPYCRNMLSITCINNKNTFQNKIYSTKNICRKTCIINKIFVSFINKQLQDQIPKAWIRYENKTCNPLYQLEFNSENIYITSFLRSYLILTDRKDNINIIEKIDFLNQKYYDLDDYCILIGIFNNYMFNIVFNWCYDVLCEIRNRYNILYHQFYNTILHDLSLNTMINMRFDCSKNMFQAIYTCSMYTLIHQFNPDKKKRNYLILNFLLTTQIIHILKYI